MHVLLIKVSIFFSFFRNPSLSLTSHFSFFQKEKFYPPSLQTKFLVAPVIKIFNDHRKPQTIPRLWWLLYRNLQTTSKNLNTFPTLTSCSSFQNFKDTKSNLLSSFLTPKFTQKSPYFLKIKPQNSKKYTLFDLRSSPLDVLKLLGFTSRQDGIPSLQGCFQQLIIIPILEGQVVYLFLTLAMYHVIRILKTWVVYFQLSVFL